MLVSFFASSQSDNHKISSMTEANPATTASSRLSLDSTQLLNGQKAVTILHNGTPYRLQATKLGKLILTK